MPSREDERLDEIITSVAGDKDDAAGASAFAREIQASLRVPTFGLVLGQRVQVEGVELPNPRRGIVARLRKDGRSREVALLDVVIPGRSRGALLVRAYQRWAGVGQYEDADVEPRRATAPEETVEAVVLKVASETARLRPLGEDQEVTLRGSGSDVWKLAPGQIVTVRPRKRWSHRRYQYLSGNVEGMRVDTAALGLRPIELREHGAVETGEPYGADLDALWAVVSNQSNIAFELERVVPGADEHDGDDPVLEALDLRSAGDNEAAEKVLMELLHADLRCLDAHALLGEWTFEMSYDSLAAKALVHFEVGVGIGELSLGPYFKGRAPWQLVGNRPYLRCLHGLGLALWRQERTSEAAKAFERACALDPTDPLGARLCWGAVRHGTTWTEWSREG